MTLAIDRQSLVDALWRGYARVAVGPIPHGIWAREPALEPLAFDPGAARALLKVIARETAAARRALAEP